LSFRLKPRAIERHDYGHSETAIKPDVSPVKRLLVVAPAVTAFIWWLVKHGPDVDAWSVDRTRGDKRDR
jgi:hypothetical protein